MVDFTHITPNTAIIKTKETEIVRERGRSVREKETVRETDKQKETETKRGILFNC